MDNNLLRNMTKRKRTSTGANMMPQGVLGMTQLARSWETMRDDQLQDIIHEFYTPPPRNKRETEEECSERSKENLRRWKEAKEKELAELKASNEKLSKAHEESLAKAAAKEPECPIERFMARFRPK